MSKDLQTIITSIKKELATAMVTFPPIRSHHEGYAVIKEELDELWDAIKANDSKQARTEAIQIAAMAIRFLIDLYE